jgi:hypothetical protein
MLTDAISSWRALPEPNTLVLARLLLARAELLISTKHTAAAEPLVREAIGIREKQLPKNSWPIDSAHLIQAELTGSTKEAEDRLSQLRTKLGDHAFIVQAATDRVAARNGASRAVSVAVL